MPEDNFKFKIGQKVRIDNLDGDVHSYAPPEIKDLVGSTRKIIRRIHTIARNKYALDIKVKSNWLFLESNLVEARTTMKDLVYKSIGIPH